jgi:hypothetical protein
MNLYTKCYIPSLKNEIKIKNITFGDYFKLNSYIENSDYDTINDGFNEICEKSSSDYNLLTNIDKFIILLHQKINFINPILKLSAKDDDSNIVSYEILLRNILKESFKYNINSIKLPKNMYYADVDDILNETGNSIDSIKKHINDSKILMFEVPDFIKGIPKIYLNCFDNTLFYFSKLLYTSNLQNMYKKIIFLKKNFNFLLSEIYDMDPKELEVFLNTK